MSAIEDEKRNRGADDDSEIQKNIEESMKKTTSLEKDIGESSSRVQKETMNLEEETEKVYNSISGELKAFNETASSFTKGVKKAGADISGAANDFTSSIEKLIKEIERWSFYVIIVALSIAAIRLLVLLINVNTLSFDPALITTILLVLSIAASVNLTLRLTHEKFASYQNAVKQASLKVLVDTFALISRPLELETDPGGIKSKFSAFLTDFNRTISAVSRFVPYVSEFYALKNKLHRIQVFTQSVKNSLRNLGIGIDAKAENYLRTYFPKEEGDDEWLVDVSGKLSKQLAVPAEAITLAYYEYTDNTEGKRNEWNKILKDQLLLAKLISVLCQEKVVDVRYFDVHQALDSAAIQLMLTRIQSFSLEEFRKTYYAFYDELADCKKNLISALGDYSIKIDDTAEREILTFVPQKVDRQAWTSEFIEKTSNIISLHTQVLELVFSDKTGDYNRRKQAWESLRKDASIKELVRFLLKQKKLDIPSHYVQADNLTDFIAKNIANNDDYSLLNITITVSEVFSELDNKKKLLSQAIEHYAAPLYEEDRTEFQSFLPHNNPIFDALTQYISQKAGFREEIARLFYFTYVQREVEEKSLFQNIQKSGLVTELAALLINKKKIDPPEVEIASAISDLVFVLKSMNGFDLIRSQNLLNRYFGLMNYSQQIADFAQNEKLVKDRVSFDFEHLLKIMGKNIEAEALEQLKTLFEYILKTDDSSSTLYSLEDFPYVIIAVATVFLSRIRDNNRAKACQQASHSETASEILYQYVHLNETRIGQETVSLKEVINGVISHKYSSYDFLPEFKLHLANGILVSSLQELISTSLQEINQKITVDIKEYREAFAELQVDIKTVLSTELTHDAVTLFLNSNLISAYLITTSQPGPVIRGIIDDTMQKCCEKLALNNPSYNKFLLTETKSKSVGGFYTRTGLVPLGMPFKEFCDKFETVFKEARETYKKDHPKDSHKDYSINLLRILPSDIAFRAIGLITEKQLPSLMGTVGKLMVEKFDLMDNFQFAASLSGEEPKLKLKKVVTIAIDQYTSIYMLIKTETGHIASKNHHLKNIMESKTLDKKLMSRYDCKNLSELSVTIHKARKAYESGRHNFETEFQKIVGEIIANAKGTVEQDQLQILSNAIFAKLDKYGRILSL